ncbi:MAG TPA: biotin/lipoyl-containing protein [bacterium]|nr:biotin/lipoyl-containing protein [bacterium]
MTTYYVRVLAGVAGRDDRDALEAAVDETPDGLRVTAVPPPPVRGRGAAKPGARRVDLAELVPDVYSLVIDGRSHTLAVAAWRTDTSHRGPGDTGGGVRRWTLLLDGVAVTAEVGRSPRVRGGTQAAAGTAGQVRAPMPGLVVAVPAGPGTAVVPGQPLIIMEAMKMQMEIRAPRAGVVRDVRVAPGQDVAGNDLLATVE